jgi:prephenate dehydrogenase
LQASSAGHFNKVAIVGVGLIGASFGLALRKAGFTGPLIGVSSPGALAEGLEAGAISETASLQDAAERADLIYLAQPVDRIIETLAKIGSIAPPDALITDAGSTKVAIVAAAAQHVTRAQFLGGHPMAGKESRGALNADGHLFRGRPYVLEPAAGIKVDWFRHWIKRIGAEIVEMTPERHDAAVALTSHLPQLLSTTLAAVLANQPNRGLTEVFGSGLLDMTRLALSPADLWSSILATNSQNVENALDDYIRTLVHIKNSLRTPELSKIFDASARFASSLRKPNY